MSKIIQALKKVEQMRNDQVAAKEPDKEILSSRTSSQYSTNNTNQKDADGSFLERSAVPMKNNWLIWGLAAGVIGVVLFFFNYHGGKEAVPLSEIFPEQKGPDGSEVEYVFMDQQGSPATEKATQGQAEQLSSDVAVSPTTAMQIAQPTPSPVQLQTNTDLVQAAYTIQVASFQKKELAESEVKRLTDSGHPAFLVSKDLPNKGMWYRIYVGAFQNRDDANKYIAKLKDGYKSSFVLHR